MKLAAKLAACMTAAAICVALSGCEKKKDTDDSSDTSSVVVSDSSASPSKVELKSYAFPDFLNTLEEPDLLSREVYQSFNKAAAEVAVQSQPFTEHSCISKISDKIYTYSEGGHVGVLNMSGTVVLKADRYTKITSISNDMLVCSYMQKEKEVADYYRIFDNGSVVKTERKSFNADLIMINELVDTDQATGEEFKKFAIQFAEGKNVEDPSGNYLWDSAEKCDPQKINTGKTYRAYYKVSNNGASYYICFDSYYNYVIYEASYARVRLKIGNVSGECYVQSFEDYTELNKMVKSFGKAPSTTMPDGNESLDYIQITFGLNSPDQQEMTVSSDGWCLVDNITHNNQPDNKYFACYDKDSFVSLVLWVDEVLSKEYTVKN
ncbi:MAG: hypothetical protein II574_10315 [Ruminococcus sp.]|nr:hypothetical protein [Ruminococcus sp.]